jgi:TBC1 domain family member 2
MNPLLAIFQQVFVQELFERVLFIWAIRHPASGYVQGINDLVTPFFLVFLSEFVDHGTSNEHRSRRDTFVVRLDVDIDTFDVDSLSDVDRRIVEADSFWATSYLLEGIQDNYTFAQPGIQYKLRALEELIKRIDGRLDIYRVSLSNSIDIHVLETLYRHLKSQHIEFLQFAFRWMNNLLMREFPMRCTIRLWDTYLVRCCSFVVHSS